MGYQPTMPKRKDVPAIRMKDEETAFEIHQHLYILILRKSAGKLLQYLNCFEKPQYGSENIIEIKYNFSKCRPEVLAMMEAMARDPKRFRFDSSDNLRKVLYDDVHGTHFQYYNFSSNPNRVNPKLYINGHEFLNQNELQCISSVILSLDTMCKNEYKFQEDLKRLEEQNNVFAIYKNEKFEN